MLYFPAEVISSPSRVQVSLGLGIPLTGHLIRTVLLVRAVMLSPTLTVTGVVSLTGITLPFSGTSIDGFFGSEENTVWFQSIRIMELYVFWCTF